LSNLPSKFSPRCERQSRRNLPYRNFRHSLLDAFIKIPLSSRFLTSDSAPTERKRPTISPRHCAETTDGPRQWNFQGRATNDGTVVWDA
jgi:hypothetical protein